MKRSPLVLAAGILLGAIVFPTLTSAEDWGDLVGDERIPLIQQRIKERGLCWVAGPTSVSNLSDEEKQRLLGAIPPGFDTVEPDPCPILTPERDLPAVWDWRTTYKVSAVKNQSDCGSCWLFGPVAVMESAILIYDEQYFNVSEQQILSCVSYGWGCGGGWPSHAFQHLRDYGTIEESCMPYAADDTDPCTEDDCEVVASINQYYSVSNTVANIKNAIYNYGPVSTGFYVWDDFFYYNEGCYEGEPTGSTNHIMAIVGWDDTQCDGEGAWIVKNSWDRIWGMDGFAYIKYGTSGIGLGTQRVSYSPQLHLLEFATYGIDDSGRNGNGFLDPGETVGLAVTLMNEGKGPATGVTGVLRTTAAGVTVTDSIASFSDMPSETSGTTDSPHFEISLDGRLSSGDWIEFELSLSTDTRVASVSFPVYVGEFTEVFMDDFETDQGWTVGAPDDDATEGIWERVVTNEKRMPAFDKAVQPGKDATVHPGALCFVTENSPLGTKVRFGDVDDGKTTLLSPILDLSIYVRAVLTYRRWYTDDGIPPFSDGDPFTVDVSNDGGSSWTNLETLTDTPEDRQWNRLIFDLSSAVVLTSQMQIRFVAADYPPSNSVVEAGVDDIELRGFGELTAVAAGSGSDWTRRPRTVLLGPIVPNPFNPETQIAFGLPKGTRVDLSVYNVRGQRVRVLAEGWIPAGFHAATWDGRDGSGRAVAAGVYFCRLTTRLGSETRRMTLLK